MKNSNLLNETVNANLTIEQVIDLYEDQRKVMPETVRVGDMKRASSIESISNHFDAFIFDSYGVLNLGKNLIPAAPILLNKLKSEGKILFVLTNGASFPTFNKVKQFNDWGFPFEIQNIISSRDLLKIFLQDNEKKFWGVIGSPLSDLSELGVNGVLLGKNMNLIDKCDGFIYLGSEFWNLEKQNLLTDKIGKNHTTVLVGNPDIVAPQSKGFSLEPGYWSWQFHKIPNINIQYFGKPHVNVFNLALKRNILKDIDPSRIAMVGDSLHTDILGGLAANISSILITDYGLFRNHDFENEIKRTKIYPDWIVPCL